MVRETRISPGPASAATRAPVCAAMPRTLAAGPCSISPVCIPARTCRPRLRNSRSSSPPRWASRRPALQAAYAMPVKDPCDGCHGIKEAAILAALQRIRLCEAAAEVLDKLAQRLQAALDRLQQVPYDLGEVYELVYQFIRKGGKLPVYARWIEGAEAGW